MPFFRVFHMPNRVSFGLPPILFSKIYHRTYFRLMANVELYHLFALMSIEKWPRLGGKGILGKSIQLWLNADR